MIWDEVKNITFDGNVIAHILDRTTYIPADGIVDLKGGLAVCVLRETICSDLSIVNNLAAGITYAGFIVPGHKCGDDD